MQQSFSSLLSAVILLSCGSAVVRSTQVRGSISYDADNGQRNFVFFLSRFGVQKGHQMYTYGTVYRNNNDQISYHSLMTLVLIPQGTWDNFYGKAPRHSSYSSGKCEEVITTTLNSSKMLDDDRCPSRGSKDYLRKVPCDYLDGVYTQCNQPPNLSVINGQNFTFHVIGAPKTEYYYLFLMTCTRNSTVKCEWAATSEISISYDIHLVNAHPNDTNPYTNEFPYDLQGTLTLQMVFSMFYLTLIPIHFILHSRFCVKGRRYSMHILVKVFSASLVLESLYVVLELLHSSVYASNGQGVVALKYLGEVANQISDWLLILVVILVGKGWQVTTSSLRWSKVTAGIWGAYIVFSAAYFVWMVVSEQVYPLSLSLYHSYQSWVGGIYLAYRLFILFYLLYEMRQVYMIEIRPTALWLYVILAVCYIVWFSYLPLITLITLGINPVRRLLVMSAVYQVFDFLINFGMVVLFCPRWANKFFQFSSYINVLSQSPYVYTNLKAYGSSSPSTPI